MMMLSCLLMGPSSLSLMLLLMMMMSTRSRMFVDGAVVALTHAVADDYVDVPTAVLLSSSVCALILLATNTLPRSLTCCSRAPRNTPVKPDAGPMVPYGYPEQVLLPYGYAPPVET
jgi:hypothetical protein